MLKAINTMIGKLSVKNVADAVVTLDNSSEDDEEENAGHSAQRDFLWILSMAHERLREEFDERIKPYLEQDKCMSDTAINLYLERILQPLSDSTIQNILFVPTEFYRNLKNLSPDDDYAVRYMKRYEIQMIEKFVFVCSEPGHFITIIIEHELEENIPTITFLDSMSTVEPDAESAVTSITNLMNIFSALFVVDIST